MIEILAEPELALDRADKLESVLERTRAFKSYCMGAHPEKVGLYRCVGGDKYVEDGVVVADDLIAAFNHIGFSLYMDLVEEGQEDIAKYVMEKWRRLG